MAIPDICRQLSAACQACATRLLQECCTRAQVPGTFPQMTACSAMVKHFRPAFRKEITIYWKPCFFYRRSCDIQRRHQYCGHGRSTKQVSRMKFEVGGDFSSFGKGLAGLPSRWIHCWKILPAITTQERIPHAFWRVYLPQPISSGFTEEAVLGDNDQLIMCTPRGNAQPKKQRCSICGKVCPVHTFHTVRLLLWSQTSRSGLL